MIFEKYNFKRCKSRYKIVFQRYNGSSIHFGGLFIYFNKSLIAIYL